MESELSDSDKAYPVMNDAEEDDEEEAAPRRGRSTRRSSFGLRVAFQFPTKKLARTPDKDSSHLLDSKTDLRRKKSSRQPKGKEDSASDAEDESRAESQENSDALLKRAMNIKENKAMVCSCSSSWDHSQLPQGLLTQLCSLERKYILGTFVTRLALVWGWKDSRTVYPCCAWLSRLSLSWQRHWRIDKLTSCTVPSRKEELGCHWAQGELRWAGGGFCLKAVPSETSSEGMRDGYHWSSRCHVLIQLCLG